MRLAVTTRKRPLASRADCSAVVQGPLGSGCGVLLTTGRTPRATGPEVMRTLSPRCASVPGSASIFASAYPSKTCSTMT